MTQKCSIWLRNKENVDVLGDRYAFDDYRFYPKKMKMTKIAKKPSLFPPRLELGTFSVLDWRDDQLHHGNKLLRTGRIERTKYFELGIHFQPILYKLQEKVWICWRWRACGSGVPVTKPLTKHPYWNLQAICNCNRRCCYCGGSGSWILCWCGIKSRLSPVCLVLLHYRWR